MAVLSGLRSVSEQLTMELKNMGISLAIEKNVFIRDAWESGFTKGEAQAMRKLLRGQLETKFGPLPKWSLVRLQKATTDEAQLWSKKVLTARTLEGVIGKQKATPASPAK